MQGMAQMINAETQLANLKIDSAAAGRAFPPDISSGLLCLTLAFILWGCGQEPAGPAATAAAPPAVPPTASIGHRSSTSGGMAASDSTAANSGAATEDATEETRLPEPEKGSAEWMIREITRLRTAPLDVIRQPIPGQPGKFEEVRLTPEQVQQEKSRRLEQVITLAMQAIAKTHQDPSREQIFNNAVHYLSDARLELALAGQEEQTQLLNENADALFARDATSFAAVEAASRVLQLTQAQAQRNANQDPKWAAAFARQARLFAEKFPQESGRAALNLIEAGRMCEQFGLVDDALDCYAVVASKFPETPFADQVAGPLRRLRLPGQTLAEFGGSTQDGGFLSIDQYRGKVVLIAFWASNSAQFQNDLPLIQRALAKYPQQVTAVGVNLDRDEIALDRFLEETGLGWKHIFYSDPEKRGVRNLVARYYGVTQVPAYWLVDAQGVVRSVKIDVAHLDAAIQAAQVR